MFDRRGSRKYLNDAERRAFFKAAHGESDDARRAFCLTLYYTGCRISEALNLTAGRIDLSERCIVFETLKRRRSGMFRAVPIPDSLVTVLGKLTAKADASAHVWEFSRSTAYRMVKECMKKSKIAGGMASPKGLRHGFAVACVGKSIPPSTLQKWLGHARLETTAIYLGVVGKEERNLARRIWKDE